MVEDAQEERHQGSAQETARDLTRAIETDPDPVAVAPLAVAVGVLTPRVRVQAVRQAYAVPDIAKAGQALEHLVVARVPAVHA